MKKLTEPTGAKVYCNPPVMVDISDLKPNPANPNMHPDEQLRLIAKALNEGWREPITVSNRSGLIVRGHGRLMAAKAMGETQVPVDYQDYESEFDEMSDLVRDNELSRQSMFDLPVLKDIIEGFDVGVGDLELFGMGEDKLAELMQQFHVESDAFAESLAGMPDGDRLGFQQMTFTLSDDQVDEVKAAVKRAKDISPFVDTGNENSNGNALARICEAYVG